MSSREGFPDLGSVEVDDKDPWIVAICGLDQDVFQVEIAMIDTPVVHESDSTPGVPDCLTPQEVLPF